jgi:hypothetical protein
MKNPHPATELALVLRAKANELHPTAPQFHDGRIAVDATRIVTIAAQVRKLGEASCNAELTSRQEKRKDSLEERANLLLSVYGFKLANPWGLCRYAVPLDHNDCTQTGCTFLA